MPRLVAIKELHYAGKTRLAGVEFDASEKDAKILKAIRKARDAHGEPKPNPTDLPARPAPDDGTAALRTEYEALVGKRPFMGWGAADLREKMATYRRRDLTVSDYGTTAMKADD